MLKPEFALLRGDARQPILCHLLEDAGYRTQLLPAPAQWKYENLPPPGTRLPVATLTPTLQEAAEAQGFLLMEYGSRPDFKAENGHITAENAICLGMLRGIILRNTPVLVFGHGAIGSALSQKLTALGAKVWVAARSATALSAAAHIGCYPIPLDRVETCLPRIQLVFNTSPALVLQASRLRLLPPGVPVIDLASAPGGTDFESAKALGIEAVSALGLPGKMTPLPAATAIFHTLMQMLREECT